jgi:hypothetical protein
MDVIDLSRPQTQKILVLQSVQFRVAGNSWGYGCSVFVSGVCFSSGFRFLLQWAVICSGVSFLSVLGILYLCRDHSFHFWACIQGVGHFIMV